MFLSLYFEIQQLFTFVLLEFVCVKDCKTQFQNLNFGKIFNHYALSTMKYEVICCKNTHTCWALPDKKCPPP